MRKDEVLSRVKETVEALPGIIAFHYLDDDWRKQLMLIEKEAEGNGACGGLMPFTNKGVWAAFDREVQFVFVAASDSILLGLSSGLVYMEDQKGQVVGEWVNAERIEKLRGQENVCFLSDDFVLYPEVEVEGEPHFVLPIVDFPYLKDVEGVGRVATGSVSTLADDYIRQRLGYGDTDHWTHLVGFDIKPE